MEIQTTTLRITQKISSVIGYIDHRFVTKEVFKILVGRKRKPLIGLCTVKNLTATKNLSIQIEDSSGDCIEVLLPESIHSRMIHYFQNSPEPRSDIDCLGWIVEILGGNRGSRFVDDGAFDYLGAEQIDSSRRLMPGDIITLCDGTVESFQKGKYHYALYLGNDIFLSKLGYNGPIVATNMSQLRDICPGYMLIVKLLLQYRGQK